MGINDVTAAKWFFLNFEGSDVGSIEYELGISKAYFNKKIVTNIILTWTLSGFCDTSIWTYWTSIWIVTGYIYYLNLV